MRIEIPTWILCGSHDKFEFTLQAVFNPNRIQIGLNFFVGPNRCWAHLILFSHFFSLSSTASLPLSLPSRPLQSPDTAPIFSHYRAPYSHNSFSKTNQKLQYHIHPDQWTLKNDFTNFISFPKILSKKNKLLLHKDLNFK